MGLETQADLAGLIQRLREEAADLIRLVDAAKDPPEKVALKALAAELLNLAEQTEKLFARQPPNDKLN
ncbi:MAG: hypothetical protein ABW006_06490 [Hyphomicrobium sp.]